MWSKSMTGLYPSKINIFITKKYLNDPLTPYRSRYDSFTFFFNLTNVSVLAESGQYA